MTHSNFANQKTFVDLVARELKGSALAGEKAFLADDRALWFCGLRQLIIDTKDRLAKSRHQLNLIDEYLEAGGEADSRILSKKLDLMNRVSKQEHFLALARSRRAEIEASMLGTSTPSITLGAESRVEWQDPNVARAQGPNAGKRHPMLKYIPFVEELKANSGQWAVFKRASSPTYATRLKRAFDGVEATCRRVPTTDGKQRYDIFARWLPATTDKS